MKWTMPRPVLQVVAAVLTLGALSSFTLGIINAPERGGRLPGERAAGEAGGPATAINAIEATPLSQERIEGPPPVEKAANKTGEEAAGAVGQAVNATPPAKTAEATKPPSGAGDNISAPPPEITAPPPEEPPH